MNLQQLEYFVNLAQTLNYTKSAKLLCISQPALSMSINKLEDELDANLFIKRGKDIILSEYGTCFLQYATGALKSISIGTEQLSALKSGASFISIGIPLQLDALYIAQLLKDFKQIFHDINVFIVRKPQKDLFFGLQTGTFDWVICPNQSEHIDIPNINSVLLFAQPLVALISMDNPLSKQETVTMKDVLKENIITHDPKIWRNKPLCNQYPQLANMSFHIISPNNELIFAMVQFNLGIHICTRLHMDQNMTEHVVMRPIIDMNEQNYFLAWYDKPYISEENKHFREFMREYAKKHNQFLFD